MKPAIFLLGLAFAIFSHPKIRGPIMARLFNEGMVAPRAVKPEDAEVIKFAGPNLSLLFIGVVLMIVSFVLKTS